MNTYTKNTRTTRTTTKAVKRPVVKFAPSLEQAAIIAASKTGCDMRINAFAGTGKSTTLRFIAEANPGKRILYLVFNKANAVDATASMPDNVTAKTVSAFAWTPIMRPRQNRSASAFFDLSTVADILISAGIFTDKKLARDYALETVIPKLGEFFKSEKLELSDILSDDMSDNDRELLLPAMRAVYDRYNSDSMLSLTFDHYLKLCALQKAQITEFDIIMVDEFQDSNPVTVQLLRRFVGQKIIVGDRWQSIYGWRGAVNALSHEDYSNFNDYYLTESYRFTAQIADTASMILAAQGETHRIIGRGKGIDEQSIGIICRTNAGIISEMMSCAASGKSYYADYSVGNLVNNLYTIFAYYQASKGGELIAPKFPAKNIWGRFESFEEIEKAKAFSTECSLIKRGYTPWAVELALKGMSPEKTAQVHITTCHKSKGREWDIVIISDDFIPQGYDDGLSKEELVLFQKEQGLNLIYVCCTRAKTKSIISDKLKKFIEELSEIFSRD